MYLEQGLPGERRSVCQGHCLDNKTSLPLWQTIHASDCISFVQVREDSMRLFTFESTFQSASVSIKTM